MAQYRAHIPSLSHSRNREPERRDLTQVQFRSDQYADSGLGQVFAVSVEVLMFLSRKQCYSNWKLGSEARITPVATVGRTLEQGLSWLRGHACFSKFVRF